MTDPIIHELIRRRWSPTEFTCGLLATEDVQRLLEAARWAPSCFNEQPWRFLVAPRDRVQAFERLAACLNPKNRQWARHASLLLLTTAKMTFTGSAKPNRHALHDVGLAVAQLTLQATSMGLGVHQMAGFDAQKARDTYSIPNDFVPVSMLAVGFSSNPNEARVHQRARNPLGTLAFEEAWGSPYSARTAAD